MTLSHKGIQYAIDRSDLRALIATIGKPQAPIMVRGCSKCKLVCHGGNADLGLKPLLCDCCQNYGRNFGGGRTYYPVDCKHVNIATLMQLAEKMGMAA